MNPMQELIDQVVERLKAETKPTADVLDGHEAAELLRVSYWKVMTDAKAGKIPFFRMGQRVLFRRDALLQWVVGQEEGNVKKNGKIRRVG